MTDPRLALIVGFICGTAFGATVVVLLAAAR